MDIEPSLYDYWRVVHRRRWLILGILAATEIGTAIYTSLQTPLYRSSAMVKFEPPGTRIVGMELSNWDQYAALQTQLRLLTSQEMAVLAAKQLGLAPGQRLPGSFGPGRVPDSNLLTINATSADPASAAKIANAVAEAYLQRDKDERSTSSRQALDDITKRAGEVEQNLRRLEEARSEYLKGHHLSGMGSTLTSSLLELENRRRELLKKFTPQHPDVTALEQRIEATRVRLAEMPIQETGLERISRDLKINEELYITLSRQAEEAKIALASVPSFVTIISRAGVPDAPFYPNKKSSNILGALFGLLLGLIAAFLLENLDISISTIEEIEKVLGIPVLGVVPHLGNQKKWEIFKAKLLRKQRYPIDVFRSMLLFQQSSKSPVIEVYHGLRKNIDAHRPGRKKLVLTFTSTGVAEGKTLTSVNFALAAAHSGLKTLLIGADLRRPVMYRIFGLPKLPGLMEVLMGKVPWQDTIRGTVDFLMGEIDLDRLLSFPGIDNFHVMTGWAANSEDVVALLNSPAMPKLVNELRNNFDLVIFDCPPVLLFVDAVLIGQHTDGVAMIYKAGKMARQALRRAKDQVLTAKADIVGVILNDMQSTDMEPRYGYYYDYGHYASSQES
jgi:uncharacterized protein involved in exopolysaccharide biosynthesis/Mrp family chromosome partitioning ATPase